MKIVVRTIFFILLFILPLAVDCVFAVPPDFNADRRVNIRRPCDIDNSEMGRFEMDGFTSTVRRLYNELDDNLKASERKSSQDQVDGYVFSNDPNNGVFFICHSKAFFPVNHLSSLSPQEDIFFQEVFYVTAIDWTRQQIQIARQKDNKMFQLEIKDFEDSFIWYNALLDKQRAFIPVYGFLSMPGEADEFPTIWNSWEEHKTDTATPPESLIDYDFYKILDYRGGYYLLAKDFYEFDYRENIEDFGIIGWVEKKYITLWRSRLYYHPMKTVPFYDDKIGINLSAESEEINNFYVRHSYLLEPLFGSIVEKIDQESLHKFYKHFGFPQLSDPDENTVRVFIPGAFTPRVMRLLGGSVKGNLNTFFLLDISESMRPFSDYAVTFNRRVGDLRNKGIALKINRLYTYSDTEESCKDISLRPNFQWVKGTEGLSFIQKSSDKNYKEPLLRAFSMVLDEIESLQGQKLILPLQEKLLFIITDAGPNDWTTESFRRITDRVKGLNLSVYFVLPGVPGILEKNDILDDNPEEAYVKLEELVSAFESGNNETDSTGNFKKFKFKAERLHSEGHRHKDFSSQHRILLDSIDKYTDYIFGNIGKTGLPRDVVLYFSDEKLLTEIRKWSDRKIQVLNHVIKYITDVDDISHWEERIAIPARPVESYLRAIKTQDDVTMSDLKKLVIINSLVSVDDIDKCRRLYDHIKPLIEKKTFKSADDVFYTALTRRAPGETTQWNSDLGEEMENIEKFLASRGFYLNSFNQAVQRKFMYIKVSELYGPR